MFFAFIFQFPLFWRGVGVRLSQKIIFVKNKMINVVV
jgi:hypothetical protein